MTMLASWLPVTRRLTRDTASVSNVKMWMRYSVSLKFSPAYLVVLFALPLQMPESDVEVLIGSDTLTETQFRELSGNCGSSAAGNKSPLSLILFFRRSLQLRWFRDENPFTSSNDLDFALEAQRSCGRLTRHTECLPSYDASFTSQTDYLQQRAPGPTLGPVSPPSGCASNILRFRSRPQNPVSFIRCNHNRAITKHGPPSVTHCPFERWCHDSVCVQSGVTEANRANVTRMEDHQADHTKRTAKAVVVNVLDWFS